jgi:uncharacterized damage-inducible protein DinB
MSPAPFMYKSLLDRLKNQHETVEHLLAKVDHARAQLHPTPGKWSIHDNIAHLTRYQLIFMDRVKKILAVNNPDIERYKAENDPDFERWRQLSVAELSIALKKNRETIFNLITSLTNDQLNRQGRHTKYGSLTIIQWTEFFLLHESHHLFTIFQLANDIELK